MHILYAHKHHSTATNRHSLCHRNRFNHMEADIWFYYLSDVSFTVSVSLLFYNNTLMQYHIAPFAGMTDCERHEKHRTKTQSFKIPKNEATVFYSTFDILSYNVHFPYQSEAATYNRVHAL